MTDLVKVVYDHNLKEGEYAAWSLEGPSSEEHITDPSNLGKTVIGLKEIDLVNDINFWTPRWLKNRAKEILEETDKN